MKFTSRAISYIAILILTLSGSGPLLAALNDGLVAHYPFSGNAIDATGNGHDGTIIGGVTPTTDRFGTANSALRFNGTSGHIDLGTSINFPRWYRYSVSVWVLGEYQPRWGKIIDKTIWFHDWHLFMEGSDHVDPYTGNLGVGMYENGEFGTRHYENYRDGNWHHIVVIRNGTQGEMWIDGELAERIPSMRNIITNGNLVVGYSHSPDHHQRLFFKGKIDDIRFYNRALTQDEIRQLSNAPAFATNYIDVCSVPDINFNGASELAALRTLPDGSSEVVIKDSETKRFIDTIGFPKVEDATPVGVVGLQDTNGNGSPDVGLLMVKSTGKGVVKIRDGQTGRYVREIAFFGGKWKAVAATAQDADVDGHSEISVMATKKDGTGAAINVKDARTGKSLKWIGLPAK